MGSCYRVERMGIGISLGNNPSSKDLYDTILKIKENKEENKYRKKMKHVQKMIHFKELRSGQDMSAIVRKTIKFN